MAILPILCVCENLDRVNLLLYLTRVRKAKQCNTRCTTIGTLWSQVQSPLEITCSADFILLFPASLLQTLPESSILETTRLTKYASNNNNQIVSEEISH